MNSQDFNLQLVDTAGQVSCLFATISDSAITKSTFLIWEILIFIQVMNYLWCVILFYFTSLHRMSTQFFTNPTQWTFMAMSLYIQWRPRKGKWMIVFSYLHEQNVFRFQIISTCFNIQTQALIVKLQRCTYKMFVEWHKFQHLQVFWYVSLFSFEVVQVLHDKLLDMVGKIQ